MTIGNRLLFLVLGVVACQLTTAAVQVTLSSKETALQNTIDSEITAMRAKLDAFDKSRNGIVNFTWTALSAQNPEAQNAALALQAKQYLSFQENSKGLDFFQKYDPKIAELEQDLKKWETELKSAGLLNSWSAASQPDRMQKMWSNVVPISRKLDSDSFEIHDELNKKEAQFRSSLQSIQATSNTLNWFAPLVAILIIIAQAAMQIRSIQNFLERITSALGGLGDQVSNSSHSLSDSASSLSAGAVQNAASLEETVSSLEELSSMVERNADNSRQASMLAQTSRRTAETGASDISSLIESIHGIANQSTKIEEIISVIDGISFQTNLLALNAAVEAARAGEQGKGFAVVADAVRNLAQKSSEAAKDISTLIKESVEKSKMGVEQASRAGETLNRIVTDAIKVSDLITEIASASSEQAQGVGQISKAMNQLDAVTQGNAASSQQTADSSGALSENSDELKLLIGELSAFVRNDTRKLLNQKGNIAQKSTYNSPKNPSNRQNFKSTAHRLTTNEVKNSGQRSSTLARSPGTTHSRPASANLVGVIRKSSNPPSNAAQVIPFDSDDFDENNGPEAKLGNASGF